MIKDNENRKMFIFLLVFKSVEKLNWISSSSFSSSWFEFCRRRLLCVNFVLINSFLKKSASIVLIDRFEMSIFDLDIRNDLKMICFWLTNFWNEIFIITFEFCYKINKIDNWLKFDHFKRRENLLRQSISCFRQSITCFRQSITCSNDSFFVIDHNWSDSTSRL